LEALASDPASSQFLPALIGSTVESGSGGAIINTNGFSDTIAAPIVHGSGTPDGGLTLNDTALTSGTLTLSGTSTFSGPTIVIRGELVVTGAVSATSAVNVGSGGALELGVAGALSATAPLTLSGGILQTLASETESVGSLTLGAGAANLTLGTTGSIINFADSSANTWTGTLTIADWNGNSTGGGSDEVFIGSTEDLTTAQLADISFVNPTINGVSYTFTASAVQLADGEIIAAVPEPGAWAMLLAGAAMLGIWQQRNRRTARHR
jgi:autotransporter-associated beta strand protein